MIVQIYTLQSVEEALEVESVGVHNIGLAPASIGLPGEISNETLNTTQNITTINLEIEFNYFLLKKCC